MTIDPLLNEPIPPADIDWMNWKKVPIHENQEQLVNAIYLDKNKFLIHPVYFLQKIEGSIVDLFLRESVIDRLQQAAQLLPSNFRLVLLDGWRPLKVQNGLFDSYKNILQTENPSWSNEEAEIETQKFVAKPTTDLLSPPPHSTGGALDITLEYKGNFADMGTLHDDNSVISQTNYYEIHRPTGFNEKAQLNRRLLYNIMAYSGFTNYVNEWWHFDYGNQIWAATKGETAIYGKIDALPGK